MLIFLAIMMGPGCGFMLYALSQFWREAMRLRRRPEAELPWSVTPITAFPASRCDYPGYRATGSGGNKGTSGRDVIAINQSLSRRSIERDVA